MGDGRLLVLGLGNPGPGYAQTRHNVGVWALEALAAEIGETLKPRSTLKSHVADGMLAGRQVVLAFPQTFMNDSGKAVPSLAKKYSIELPSALVVIHDELDLPEGEIRVKQGGGLAGHNGLRSIHSVLGTTEFTRVRIGISRPSSTAKVHDWVLSRPSQTDRMAIEDAIPTVVAAVELIAREGVDAAMNRINGSGSTR